MDVGRGSGEDVVGGQRDAIGREQLPLWAILVVLLGLPFVLVARVFLRQDALNRRGRTTQARVIGFAQSDLADYLEVRFTDASCNCSVETDVATRDLFEYDVNDKVAIPAIPIRYDPQDPANAAALVDAGNPFAGLWPFLLGDLGSAALIAVLFLRVRGSRRRMLSLVHETAPTARVRVEGWARTLRGTDYPHVSLYRDDGGLDAEPIMTVPVQSSVIRALRDDDRPDLYGSIGPGGRVALRLGNVILLPAGRSRSPGWETRHRRPGSQLALGAGDPQHLVPVERGLLAIGADDALRYRSLRRHVIWSFIVLVPLSASPLLPDRLLLWGAVVVVWDLAIVLTESTRLKRLLNRLVLQRSGALAGDRRGRRAARLALARQLNAPAGQLELARAMGCDPGELAADDRRGSTFAAAVLWLLVAILLFWVVKLAFS